MSRRFGDRLAMVLRPRLKLHVDTLVAGARSSGTLSVAGWAYGPPVAAARVEALLDGISLGLLNYGASRPDVAELVGDIGAEASGFSGVLPLAGVAAGEHVLTVRATDAAGRVAEIARPVVVAPPPPRVALDTPSAGSEHTGTLTVVGWAYGAGAPVSKVEATLGGVVLGSLSYGDRRPDVAELVGEAGAEASGFSGVLPLAGVAAGEHVLTVRATDAAGHVAEVTCPVVVAPPLPQVTLDTPSAGSEHAGMLTVVGWAYSPAVLVDHVEVFLGSVALGTLNHGDLRPDVARLLDDPAAAVSGFSGTLALEELDAGDYALTVRVTDSLGRTADIVTEIAVGSSRGIGPASGLLIGIDEPAFGSTSAGRIPIRGWCFGPQAPILGVEVLLDGRSLGVIPYGHPRPDVWAKFGHPHAGWCGFDSLVEFPVDAVGERTLIIRATDRLGMAIEQAIPIRLTTLDEPLATIERATLAQGVLEIDGWALWPISRAPQRARVLVDGMYVGETRINRSRPDIRRRYPQHSAASQCGYRFRHPYVPDVGATNGDNLHNIVVEASDAAGQVIRQEVHIAFAVGGERAEDARIWHEFDGAIDTFVARMDRDPAVLNWTTDLRLAEMYPQLEIFSPPLADMVSTLPYLDHSIDIVVLDDAGDSQRLDEARRVAAMAVVALDTPVGAAPGSPEQRRLQVMWLPSGGAPGPGSSQFPSVSIVIPVYNKSALTEACLARLAATMPAELEAEILVVDDSSTDETADMLARWVATGRIKVIRNDPNCGFIHSCNRGAEAAKGEVLVFLNNDTLPQQGWLPPLLRVLRDAPEAGAVGGKLVYPDGTLQEAGGVIFSDGSGWNLGKHDPAIDAPPYNFLREVDYCSGALLATRRDLFLRLGGFDTRYAPAYYEDTDYCFTVRAAGLRVYYQPESVIVHLEGATSGVDLAAGTKRYQVINRGRFLEKWRDALVRQPSPPAAYDFAAAQRFTMREEVEEA